MIIQNGELTDVLRDFFNLVGRVTLGLDDTIFGEVMVSDLTQPPFRRFARTFAQRVVAGAIAAESTGAGAYLPVASGGAGRITGITFENVTAVVNDYMVVYTVDTESLAGFADVAGFCDTERPAKAGTSLRLTPIRMCSAHAAAVPGINFEQRLALIELPARTSFWKPFDVMLYPGCGLLIYNQTVNAAVGASMDGIYYADAQKP